jgi:hypothetical protein
VDSAIQISYDESGTIVGDGEGFHAIGRLTIPQLLAAYIEQHNVSVVEESACHGDVFSGIRNPEVRIRLNVFEKSWQWSRPQRITVLVEKVEPLRACSSDDSIRRHGHVDNIIVNGSIPPLC